MKFLGLDWATEMHFAALVDEAGAVLAEWTVDHTPAGVRALFERLTQAGGPGEV